MVSEIYFFHFVCAYIPNNQLFSINYKYVKKCSAGSAQWIHLLSFEEKSVNSFRVDALMEFLIDTRRLFYVLNEFVVIYFFLFLSILWNKQHMTFWQNKQWFKQFSKWNNSKEIKFIDSKATKFESFFLLTS